MTRVLFQGTLYSYNDEQELLKLYTFYVLLSFKYFKLVIKHKCVFK